MLTASQRSVGQSASYNHASIKSSNPPKIRYTPPFPSSLAIAKKKRKNYSSQLLPPHTPRNLVCNSCQSEKNWKGFPFQEKVFEIRKEHSKAFAREKRRPRFVREIKRPSVDSRWLLREAFDCQIMESSPPLAFSFNTKKGYTEKGSFLRRVTRREKRFWQCSKAWKFGCLQGQW